MAEASDNLNRLVEDFDSVMAGSREEFDMAKKLSDGIHLHGLETIIQDFQFAGNGRTVVAGSLLLTVLFGILSAVTSGVWSIILLLLCLLAAALAAVEATGRGIVSSHLGLTYSQNLIARHPAVANSPAAKGRPIVVLAHYDVPCSDFMSKPVFRKLQPFTGMATLVCTAALLVSVLLQLFPLPRVLTAFLLAITVVSAVMLVFTAARTLVNVYLSKMTPGANDNMSSVAALLGLLDRVRPSMGEEFASRAGSQAQDALDQEDEDQIGDSSAARSHRRNLRLKMEPIRRGEKVLRSLGMVSDSTEIIYQPDLSVSAGETVISRPVDVPSALGEKSAAASGNARDIRDARDDRATRKDVTLTPEVTAAVLAATTGASSAVASASPDKTTVIASPVAEQATVVGQPSAAAQTSSTEQPSVEGATMVLTHEALRAAQEREERRRSEAEAGEADTQAAVQALTPEPTGQSRAFDVVISTDEPDAELRQSSVLPHDVAQQQGSLDEDVRRDSILNNPNWGTTSFTPVTANRRILEELPDPSVAAVDPYSVSTIETIGDLNPEDFSALNFETGTHEAVTPQMLEDYQREAHEGFTSLDDKKRSRRDRKNRRGKERIGRRAQEMQREMQEQSFSDWLGVDSDYDAQKNGRQIGSWDNFQDAPSTGTSTLTPASAPVAGENIAAPNASAMPASPAADAASAGDNTAPAADAAPAQSPTEPQADQTEDSAQGGRKKRKGNNRGKGSRSWKGGAARARRRRPRATADAEDQDISQEELRASAMALGDADLVSHEIWFVLTGASEAQNAGARAFIEEYDQRLHNAYFINLECVGAGRQSLILEEGAPYTQRKADRRLVNLLGQVSAGFNRPLALARMGWRDTELTPILRRGRHGVTVCGMADDVPANARWSGDDIRRVNPAQVNDIVDILVETIRRA